MNGMLRIDGLASFPLLKLDALTSHPLHRQLLRCNGEVTLIDPDYEAANFIALLVASRRSDVEFKIHVGKTFYKTTVCFTSMSCLPDTRLTTASFVCTSSVELK